MPTALLFETPDWRENLMTPSCVQACATYVRQRMLHFAPIHLANVCWGWALLDFYPGADDMDRISKQLLLQIQVSQA